MEMIPGEERQFSQCHLGLVVFTGRELHPGQWQGKDTFISADGESDRMGLVNDHLMLSY